ncbi:MAG: MFS transporter, partial [Alphaproteobacteria bacterium]|nr:MFS transporter [Alphaproteobacteria bacterium]
MNIRRLVPVLLSAGILLGGNGLLITLVAVRAELEGFSNALIGLMGTAYFVGFFGGCLLTAPLIVRAGHIRVFAGLSAIAAISTLIMVLVPDPWVWLTARALSGFAFSGVAMVIESWLNAEAETGDRARVLSLYRIVDLTGVTGGQFILPLVGAAGFQIFAVAALIFCVALLPVSLSRLSSPAPPASALVNPVRVWVLSPVACAGCITLGLTNGAFRTVGPLYARAVGLDVDGVALFMSLGIFAGAMLQYPLGWVSDRTGRRTAIILCTMGAAAGSLILVYNSAAGALVFVGAFVFGGFALPLYSLSAAHANDFAKPGQYVELAAGLTLFYAAGAVFGPTLSSLIISQYG